jgi:GNAT superfamily N-acetyltransferase
MVQNARFPYLERGLEQDRGWINVMFVEKEYRHQGIGQDLLDRIEKQLTDLGAEEHSHWLRIRRIISSGE